MPRTKLGGPGYASSLRKARPERKHNPKICENTQKSHGYRMVVLLLFRSKASKYRRGLAAPPRLAILAFI